MVEVGRGGMGMVLQAETLSAGWLEYDEELRVRAVNRSLRELIGASSDQLVGRRVTELFADHLDLGEGVGLPEEREIRMRRSSGDTVWVRLQGIPTFDADGRAAGGIALLTDITRSKRTAESQARLKDTLRRVASEWQLTFDAVDQPILVVERDRRVRRMNQAAMELSGRSYHSNLGRRLEELGEREPWGVLSRAVELAWQTDQTQNLQLEEDPVSGRSWDVTASPVADAMAPPAVIVIARDITTLVALQRSLGKNQVMSAMGALVAGVAHEVRNPLFGISATLDALDPVLGPEHEYAEYLEVLRHEVNRLRNLMQYLLDYGKPVELKPEPGRIEEAARDAIEECRSLAEASRVTLDLEAVDDLPAISLDRNKIVQVFKNLVDNAIRHSFEGGRVGVQLAPTTNGSLRCTVRDQGPGFRRQDFDRLFEPFYSRRQGGTGLGLAIVQRFVEEHGGSVSASNHPQGGAVVAVEFPAIQTVHARSTQKGG